MMNSTDLPPAEDMSAGGLPPMEPIGGGGMDFSPPGMSSDAGAPALLDFGWISDVAWGGETMRKDGYVCEEHPPKLSSDGIWERIILKVNGRHIWQYRLPNLELIILSIFILWQFFDILFKKLGLSVPKFTSMMFAGLLLNVIISITNEDSVMHQIVFPKNKIDIPGCLGSFGFMIFWFVKGVKMDVKRIIKAETKARVTGVAVVLFPIFVGSLLYRFKRGGKRPLQAKEYEILLMMESLTSFSGIARLLRDIGINHSSIGRVALSSALVSDMVGLICLLSLVPLNTTNWTTGLALFAALVFFLVMAFAVVRPAMFKVIKRKREGRPIENKYIYCILVLVCLSCMYWNDLDQFPALGAFFLGLAIPNGPPLGSALVERLESFNFGIVLPLFLTAAMLRADLASWRGIFTFFYSDAPKFAVASLVFLIFLLKFSVSVAVPYIYKMPLRDSIILGSILSHKGIVELSFYLFSFGLNLITRESYSILVLAIVLNSVFIPMVIGLLYDPSKQFLCYQRRNIMSMKNNGELKTLVCIHRPDHITSMINLLESSYQSEESPLICFVLHLVELQGQDAPTLISHKVQKLGVGGTGTKYSENVILSFEHFNRYVCSSISIDTFTCIAHPYHMQDDICWLALDKAVTLIILPFHRTWSLDRTSIVSDSEKIRFLNVNVLKQAPCSVGILIERHLVNKNQESQLNLKVCVLFIGGKDDREAMAYARRMARQENVSLTILRLQAAKKGKESVGWDQMLDTVELRELMRNNDESSTNYLEQEIVDGADTSMLLRSMAFDYDLFIVGKTCGENHEATRGIEGWCEFEELGVIGDFLASPDFPSKTSVLVVQQQRSVAKN